MGAICALSADIFVLFSYRRAQSHKVDARKIDYFGQSVIRASIVCQHSLLVHGGRCTNPTHIFVRSVIVKESWVCLKY